MPTSMIFILCFSVYLGASLGVCEVSVTKNPIKFFGIIIPCQAFVMAAVYYAAMGN